MMAKILAMKLRNKLLLWFTAIIILAVGFGAFETKRFLHISAENQKLNTEVIAGLNASQETITDFLQWVRLIEEYGNGYFTRAEFKSRQAITKASLEKHLTLLKTSHAMIGTALVSQIEGSFRQTEEIATAMLSTANSKLLRAQLEKLDRLVDDLNTPIELQRQAYAKRTQEAVENDQNIEKTVILAWVLVLSSFFVLLFLLRSWINGHIIQPLEVLEESTRLAGDGAFEAPDAYFADPGIMGQLFRSFREMSEKIRGSHAEMTDANIKLNSVLDHLPSGVTIRDREYNLLYHNHLVTNLFGNSVGKKCYKIFEGRETVCEGCPVELAKNDGGSHSLIKEAVYKDGSRRIFENTATPIKNAQGEVIAFLELNSEITQKVQEQKEKEEMQKQIFHTERLASIGILAAGVGHEINNPLTVITSAVHLMLQNPTFQGEKEKKKLQHIERAARRIAEIVNGLRLFSRKDSLTFTPQNVHEIIGDTMSMIQGVFASDDVRIVLAQDAKESFVLANTNHLQQIFVNLFSNARDAIKDANGAKGGMIRVQTKNEDRNLVVTISDTGPGIAPDLRAKIFEMFFTTKDPNKGTGMGLGIVQKLVHEMGGTIALAPQEMGAGATFILSFPLSQASESADTKALKQRSVFRGRVLVVDDEEDILEILKEALLIMGLEVDTARDGVSAFEIIQTKRFDYLLTDLKMKNMSGEELITKVRGLNLKGLNIVAMTGGECDVQADAKLFKPIMNDDLEKLFKSLTVNRD